MDPRRYTGLQKNGLDCFVPASGDEVTDLIMRSTAAKSCGMN